MRSIKFALAQMTVDLAGTAPEWIQLLPRSGKVRARDGRVFEAEDLQKVVEETRRYHGETDAVVDYHHQTLEAARHDLRAKAAGWVKEWKAGGPNGEDGIWARIDWTDAARQATDAQVALTCGIYKIHNAYIRQLPD